MKEERIDQLSLAVLLSLAASNLPVIYPAWIIYRGSRGYPDPAAGNGTQETLQLLFSPNPVQAGQNVTVSLTGGIPGNPLSMFLPFIGGGTSVNAYFDSNGSYSNSYTVDSSDSGNYTSTAQDSQTGKSTQAVLQVLGSTGGNDFTIQLLDSNNNPVCGTLCYITDPVNGENYACRGDGTYGPMPGIAATLNFTAIGCTCYNSQGITLTAPGGGSFQNGQNYVVNLTTPCSCS